jgi:hypothetical protein
LSFAASVAWVASAAAQQCPGDCGGDDYITVDEIVLLVNIAIGAKAVVDCEAGDINRDEEVTVDEIIVAVRKSLDSPDLEAIGSCMVPGPDEQRPLEPCRDGTPVDVYRCLDRDNCRKDPAARRFALRVNVGEGVTAGQGAFRVGPFPDCLGTATYYFEARPSVQDSLSTIDYGPVGNLPVPRRSAAEDPRVVTLSPLTEAAVRLADERGLANFGTETFNDLVRSVSDNTPAAVYVGRAVGEASAAITTVAAGDEQVRATLAAVLRHDVPSLMSLDAGKNSDFYKLSLNEPTRVILQMTRSSGAIAPCIEVVPREKVCDADSVRVELTLPAGTYHVFVSDQGINRVGSYRLYYLRLRPEDAVALPIVDSQALDVGDLDLFTFNIPGNRFVRLTATQQLPPAQPCLELWRFEDAGAEQVTTACGAQLQEQISENGLPGGRYLVVVGAHNPTEAGSYALQLFTDTLRSPTPTRTPTTGLEARLVAHWSFDACDAMDESGYGHNGEIHGVPMCTLGVRGNSLSFDGDDYYVVPDSSHLRSLSSAMTVAVWINVTGWGRDEFGGWFNIVDKYEPSSDFGWVFFAHRESQELVLQGRGGLNGHCPFTIQPNTWRHVAVAYGAGIVTFYVDGQQVCQSEANPDLNATGPLYIGYSPSGGDDPTIGRLDDLRLYNQVLSSAEIAELARGSTFATPTRTTAASPALSPTRSPALTATPQATKTRTPTATSTRKPSPTYSPTEVETETPSPTPSATVPIATITWTGAGDGTSWTVPLNWSPRRLPSAADDVLIDVPTSPTVIIDANTNGVSVNSMITREKIRIVSGSLTVATSAALDADLLLEGGAFAAALVVVNAGTMTVRPLGRLAADGIEIRSGAALVLDGNAELGSAYVLSGGQITHSEGVDTFSLVATGDLTVEEGATITADGKGFGYGRGPGAGQWGYVGQSSAGAGGGGYGGAGETTSTAGGAAYGTPSLPSELGSGGGSIRWDPGGMGWGYAYGGAGGGRIHIEVAGELRLDGTISANGAGGGIDCAYWGSCWSGGGGSGGAIFIRANRLSGDGIISAVGGGGGNSRGGGGGGGRIAVYYREYEFDRGSYSLNGAGNAGLGSLYSEEVQ